MIPSTSISLPRRDSTQGLRQVLSFNRHLYAVAGAITLIGIPLALTLPGSWGAIAGIVTAIAVGWSVSSLLVSHVVYDRSRLHEWTWMTRELPRTPESWVHVHAGLDEATEALRTALPSTRHQVFDIFDEGEMSEPSIRRARRDRRQAPETLQADAARLPLDPGSTDAVFVLFAAHELRRLPARRRLFRELYRVTRRGGAVILVEHLRDLPNFLAYGPGFLHFLSRREWRSRALEAGFTIELELPHTPFVSAFFLRKP